MVKYVWGHESLKYCLRLTYSQIPHENILHENSLSYLTNTYGDTIHHHFNTLCVWLLHKTPLTQTTTTTSSTTRGQEQTHNCHNCLSSCHPLSFRLLLTHVCYASALIFCGCYQPHALTQVRHTQTQKQKAFPRSQAGMVGSWERYSLFMTFSFTTIHSPVQGVVTHSEKKTIHKTVAQASANHTCQAVQSWNPDP